MFLGGGQSANFAYSVVFSCWTKMLDLVATALEARGIAFERLDGSMKLADRRRNLEHFSNDDSIRVLLATIGSGSVG
jgi:SWI/SNF-related matrix-associated actin-dependent regulator of chromatin subfamily A3